MSTFERFKTYRENLNEGERHLVDVQLENLMSDGTGELSAAQLAEIRRRHADSSPEFVELDRAKANLRKKFPFL